MTRNLDLPGGTTLTPADSNVKSNYTLPASSTTGFSDDYPAYVYNSNSTTCGNNQPCYSYYSYVAATAGTNPSGGNAANDICPKGWRLPTQTEYNALKNTGVNLTTSPFYGVHAGYYYSSSLLDGGLGGVYWSSTADGASIAYYLSFSGFTGRTESDYNRTGSSIRCVAKT